MRPNGIDGKIAFVTGAASGIGEAIASALVDEGARVVLTDLDGNRVRTVADSLAAGDDVTRGETLDVRRAADVDALVERIEREWGPIDILVNVAGILSTTTVLDTDASTWRDVFAANTDGVFYVSKAVARGMAARRRGAIVTVSSNAGGVPRHAMAAYAASKAAATMFTLCLGLELAPQGVRCNVVSPGSTRTPMLTSMLQDAAAGEARLIAGVPETYKAGIPLGKLAEPQDVADAVVFLVSDRSGHVTMANLYIDGGASMRV